MEVVVQVNGLGQEEYELETCAECEGTYIGAFASIIQERDQLRVKLESQPRRCNDYPSCPCDTWEVCEPRSQS